MWSKIKNIINQIIFRRKQVNFLVCGQDSKKKKKKKKKKEIKQEKGRLFGKIYNLL